MEAVQTALNPKVVSPLWQSENSISKFLFTRTNGTEKLTFQILSFSSYPVQGCWMAGAYPIYHTGRTYKLHTESNQPVGSFDPRTFLL